MTRDNAVSAPLQKLLTIGFATRPVRLHAPPCSLPPKLPLSSPPPLPFLPQLCCGLPRTRRHCRYAHQRRSTTTHLLTPLNSNRNSFSLNLPSAPIRRRRQRKEQPVGCSCPPPRCRWGGLCCSQAAAQQVTRDLPFMTRLCLHACNACDFLVMML